jgi:hypothetical protein
MDKHCSIIEAVHCLKTEGENSFPKKMLTKNKDATNLRKFNFHAAQNVCEKVNICGGLQPNSVLNS